MPSNAHWPRDLAVAISAKIVRWTGGGLGVSYVFPAGDRQAHSLGTQDYASLVRLDRAGKLSCVDDETRERYEAMKRGGLFGAAV